MPQLDLHHAFLVLMAHIRRLDGQDVFPVLPDNMLRPQAVSHVQQARIQQQRVHLVQIALQVTHQVLQQHHVPHVAQVNTHLLVRQHVLYAQQVHFPAVELRRVRIVQQGPIQVLEHHHVRAVLQDTIQVQDKLHVVRVQQEHGQAEVLTHVLSAQQVPIQYLKEQLQPQLVAPVHQAIFPLKEPPHALLVQKGHIQMEEPAVIAQQGPLPVMHHLHVLIVLRGNLQLKGVNAVHVQQASTQPQEAFVPLAVLGIIRALGLHHVRYAHQVSFQKVELHPVVRVQQINI